MLTLFAVPWLDTSKVRSARFRPLYRQFFWVLLVDVLVLGYVGANRVDATLSNTGIPLLVLGRIGTAYYFLHFWVIMPILGKTETPLSLPDSIAKPVLSHAPAE